MYKGISFWELPSPTLLVGVTTLMRYVCSKAFRGSNLLRRIAWFLPKSALVCYYNAYMLPHLMQPRCGVPVWRRHGYASATSIQKELGWDPRRDSDFALMPIWLWPWLPFLTPQAHLLCAQPHDQIYSHQRSSSPTCPHRVWKENLCLPGGPQVEFPTIKPEEHVPSLLLHVSCQGVPAVVWTLIILLTILELCRLHAYLCKYFLTLSPACIAIAPLPVTDHSYINFASVSITPPFIPICVCIMFCSGCLEK